MSSLVLRLASRHLLPMLARSSALPSFSPSQACGWHARPLGLHHGSGRSTMQKGTARPARNGENPHAISVRLPLGKIADLPTVWLRDHCHCGECVNQDTLQREFNAFSNLREGFVKEVNENTEELAITWQDGHVSVYSKEWLLARADGKSAKLKRTYWDSAIREQPPSIHYDEIMADDAGVGKWTSTILEYGFCFIDGAPISPLKTEQLLQRIAFIRVTHYGDFYDFTSDLAMNDTAYTNLALPSHTDNTYFTDPPGLQMFHIISHTSGTGGTSLLVDGFHCASLLQRADAQAYRTLCDVPVQWHASGNEGTVITPARRFPVLNLDPDSDGEELLQVRWNNPDRAAMPLEPAPHVPVIEWYEAARLWHEIVSDQKNEYWQQLMPGRPLILDNWRVMHGRSAFTGKRRMCGGYINRDDFMSRYWNTNFSRDEVLKRII